MHVNILFIIFTFIVIVGIISIVDDLTSAMLIISILTNFLVINSQFSKISKVQVKKKPKKSQESLGEFEDRSNGRQEDVNVPWDTNGGSMYGTDYDNWNAYKSNYNKNIICDLTNGGSGIDAMNAVMVQKRSREKSTIEGMITKNADYYKYHFGDELEEQENKPWWGTYEW